MKKPDFTREETAVLRALLLDSPSDVNKTSSKDTMNDDILFSLPFPPTQPQLQRAKSQRRNTILLQLWHAFEDGVKPKTLIKKASLIRERSKAKSAKSLKPEEEEDAESFCSVRSDEEVRAERTDNQDDDALSACSSWNEEDGGHVHYDSWEVLKDEYAQDFGFDYEDRMSPDVDEQDQGHVFKILGTSAADAVAHPHVLSPPLMDALMSFMPESLENQNFWLKYSLVRDGASMQTLKHYVRASTNTILAIETTDGHVFGAFTTSAWRTQFGTSHDLSLCILFAFDLHCLHSIILSNYRLFRRRPRRILVADATQSTLALPFPFRASSTRNRD